MEKEGLHCAIESLRQQKVSIGVIVTDRHRQINKWLRENHSEMKHFYDIWHVAKGKSNSLNSIGLLISY